jgi:hypothetical protein
VTYHYLKMAETKPIDETNKQADDSLLQSLKKFLTDTYTPVETFNPKAIFLTTAEVYQQLQQLYPNPVLYSQADVAQWLHQAGFKFSETGELKLEWMLARK